MHAYHAAQLHACDINTALTKPVSVPRCATKPPTRPSKANREYQPMCSSKTSTTSVDQPCEKEVRELKHSPRCSCCFGHHTITTGAMAHSL
jgi:hypothetical protein